MEKKKIKVLLCGVSWQHEIGEASDGVVIYPDDLSNIQDELKCTHSGCGVVRCEVILDEWIIPQDMKRMRETATSAEDSTKEMIKSTEEKIAKLKIFLKRLKEGK
jgi:hypothetical protein